MSQPYPNHDWPAWLNFAWGILAIPLAWAWRWAISRVSRSELETYFKERDRVYDDRRDIDDQRYEEKMKRFDQLDKLMGDTRDRVSHIEGSLSGTYRRLT